MAGKQQWGDPSIYVDGELVGIRHPPVHRTRPSVLAMVLAMRDFNKAIEFHLKILSKLLPKRIRTGIQPKPRKNRRKQRITRLQRRRKRQNKHNRRKA